MEAEPHPWQQDHEQKDPTNQKGGRAGLQVKNITGCLHQTLFHQATFTTVALYTNHLYTKHLLRHKPFTPKAFYTAQLFDQKPFIPEIARESMFRQHINKSRVLQATTLFYNFDQNCFASDMSRILPEF